MALKKYQAMFDAILVDEWQDINPMQYELVKLLAGGHRNLSVVGDDEQTIYTWRYADIKTFLNFDKDWRARQSTFLKRTIAQRQPSSMPRKPSRKTTVSAPRKNYGHQTPMATPLRSLKHGEKTTRRHGLREKFLNLKFQISNESVAVLYRTNAQSRAIEQALIRENIPYRIFGGLKFYERREVKDAVAALRYAANAKDELSSERLEKNLSRKKFAEFKEGVVAAKNPTPTEILNIFLETFGYFDYLEQNFMNANEREGKYFRARRIRGGIQNARRYSGKDIPRPIDRCAVERDPRSAKAGRKDDPVVHLSTIHLAKGLEFDTVFIAGAAEGVLPHIRSMDNDELLEEERRLMYVAMTRARKKLFISFSSIPSRFLSEIPQEYLRLVSQEDKEKDSNREGIDPESEEENYFSF